MKQEPVAWVDELCLELTHQCKSEWVKVYREKQSDFFIPLYTAPRELSDEDIEAIDNLLDICLNFSVSGVYFHEFQENVKAIDKVAAILKKASEK